MIQERKILESSPNPTITILAKDNISLLYVCVYKKGDF